MNFTQVIINLVLNFVARQWHILCLLLRHRKLNFNLIYWFHRHLFPLQLKLKQENIKKVLRKLAHEIAHINPNFKDWIDQQKAANDGAACQLYEIRHAQQIEG